MATSCSSERCSLLFHPGTLLPTNPSWHHAQLHLPFLLWQFLTHGGLGGASELPEESIYPGSKAQRPKLAFPPLPTSWPSFFLSSSPPSPAVYIPCCPQSPWHSAVYQTGFSVGMGLLLPMGHTVSSQCLIRNLCLYTPLALSTAFTMTGSFGSLKSRSFLYEQPPATTLFGEKKNTMM